MKIEQQVTNLELSKQLKELGVKQDSLFWWGDVNFSKSKEDYDWEVNHKELFATNWHIREYISAFTVAELGELLPENKIYSSKDGDKWSCSNGLNLNINHFEFEDTEADARGKMLIYLLENNLLTL